MLMQNLSDNQRALWYVMVFSGVVNPGQSWILDSTLWNPDSRYWLPVFVSRTYWKQDSNGCRILDSLSCISDSKILDFGSHMQNFPDSFTWGNQKLLKCPSCHNFLSKVGSFEMTPGFKPFTQLSLLNSKIKALVIINTVAKMMKYPVWGICHLKQSSG